MTGAIQLHLGLWPFLRGVQRDLKGLSMQRMMWRRNYHGSSSWRVDRVLSAPHHRITTGSRLFLTKVIKCCASTNEVQDWVHLWHNPHCSWGEMTGCKRNTYELFAQTALSKIVKLSGRLWCKDNQLKRRNGPWLVSLLGDFVRQRIYHSSHRVWGRCSFSVACHHWSTIQTMCIDGCSRRLFSAMKHSIGSIRKISRKSNRYANCYRDLATRLLGTQRLKATSLRDVLCNSVYALAAMAGLTPSMTSCSKHIQTSNSWDTWHGLQ